MGLIAAVPTPGSIREPDLKEWRSRTPSACVPAPYTCVCVHIKKLVKSDFILIKLISHKILIDSCPLDKVFLTSVCLYIFPQVLWIWEEVPESLLCFLKEGTMEEEDDGNIFKNVSVLSLKETIYYFTILIVKLFKK